MVVEWERKLQIQHFGAKKMADPRATLAELNKNLSILQEREAKYGGNVVRHEARYVHGARAPTANRRAVSLSP